ncbi:hypothetical protein PIB30_023663 [Stylosanthes scabra]|uniref:Uncharacterized protein n=1 Tax=Stylosanthes scabra TaxID=79078 RepID=A0ABU6R9S2_9FABA|nr:hypothetical protein [Stylosanthes scabra]
MQTEGGFVSKTTRMFDSFDTVSLGRDEGDNVAVEGPTNDAEVDDNTRVEVPPIPENVEREESQHEEPQPEPLVVIMPIHSDQPSKSLDAEVDVPPLSDDIQDATEPEPLTVVVPLQPEHPEPERTSEEQTESIEVEPEPNTMNIPLELEPELTLRPWLQDEAETSVDKDPTKSVDEMITDVLMNIEQTILIKNEKASPCNLTEGPGVHGIT